MRVRIPTLVIGVAIAVSGAALILLSSSPSARTAREAEARLQEAASDGGAAPEAVPVRTVEAYEIAESRARTNVDVTGVLAPVREVVIGAEVAGRVVGLEAEAHTPIANDEVLVRLDPALQEAAVARARAALLRSQATESLAVAELGRQTELSSQGVASAAVFDQAQSSAQGAAAEVAEARAALLDAQTRLDKTRIRAPFDGIVTALDLEPGAYVQPGMPVAEMADLSSVEIEVGLSDQQILAVGHDLPVRVSIEALPGRSFAGRVFHPGRTADARTRKYPVPVRIPNGEAALLPGMLGTVHFKLGDAQSVLRVPAKAVFHEFDLGYVYVLEGGDAGSTARRRRVGTLPIAFEPRTPGGHERTRRGRTRRNLGRARPARRPARPRPRDEPSDGPRGTGGRIVSLPAFSVRQSVLVNVLFFVLILGGLGAYSRIPVEFFTDINMNEAQITTVWPGASAEEIERLVTQKLEEELLAVSDLDELRSRSAASVSTISVEFDEFLSETEYEAALNDVRRRPRSRRRAPGGCRGATDLRVQARRHLARGARRHRR